MSLNLSILSSICSAPLLLAVLVCRVLLLGILCLSYLLNMYTERLYSSSSFPNHRILCTCLPSTAWLIIAYILAKETSPRSEELKEVRNNYMRIIMTKIIGYLVLMLIRLSRHHIYFYFASHWQTCICPKPGAAGFSFSSGRLSLLSGIISRATNCTETRQTQQMSLNRFKICLILTPHLSLWLRDATHERIRVDRVFV